MLLIYGVLTITAYAAVILGGTSMPIISGWFLESPTAATVNFYNGITVPFGIVILVLMLASLFIMVKAEMRSMANIAVAVISAAAGIMFNIMYTGFPPAYIFSVLALLIVFYHAKEIIFARSPKNLLPSRIAHIGVAVMVLGIIASSYHSSGERKKIIKDRADQVGPAVLTFKGITNEERSRLTFTLSHSAGLSEISVPYYYNERMNSLYREPFIEYGLFGDIYIIPESYDSGIDSVSIKRLTVGDDLEFSGLKIAFKGFNTSGMTSETPTVKAELTFNGRPAAPEIKMVMGRKEMIRAAVPGTDRFVTLTGLDIKHRMIEIYLTPGKSVTVPEDSVIVDVSVKRLIWFVWFGTVLISIGVFLGIFKD
jgi:cytochrome c biogenesis factor